MDDGIASKVRNKFVVSNIIAGVGFGASTAISYPLLKAAMIAVGVTNSLWAIVWALMMTVDLIDDIARREQRENQ